MFQERNGGSDQGTPRGSWASFDLRNSQPDAAIAGLLDSVDADTVDSVKILPISFYGDYIEKLVCFVCRLKYFHQIEWSSFLKQFS